jgi:segregation and condensation protein B
VSNDERPDSLAAQAAAWVPPWERPRVEPDRAYEAAHRAADEANASSDDPDASPSDADASLDEDNSPRGVDVSPRGVDVSPRGADVAADGTDASADDADGVDDDGAPVDGADDADGVDDYDAPADGADDADVSAVAARVGASVRAEQVAAVEDGADALGDAAAREVARERASELAQLDGVDGRDGGASRPDDDEDRSDAGLSDDDDDFDTAFEGGNPPGYGVSEPEEPGRAVVDEPRELPAEDEPEPTDVRLGEEVPLPGPIEEAAEAGEDEGGSPIDAPLAPDGDDAGDVFDAAADDDVTDDGEVDLPFVEVVPAGDEDEEAAFEADEAEFRAGADFGVPAGGARFDGDGADNHGTDAGGAGFDGDDSGSVGLRGRAEDGDWDTAGQDDRAGADGRDSAGLDDRAGADGRAGAGLDAEAAAYVAGAADVSAALGVGDGQQPADDAELAGARPAGRPAAGDGPGVPVQGRRRRGGDVASGGEAARTSEADDAESVTDSMPALEDEAELGAALEAIMLVVDEPVAEMQLAQILEQPTERIATALEDLSARYTAAGHGFDLRRAAGGWRFYTRPEYAAYVERFVLDGQSVRLTQAALETLAVVAYKQPVTRSRISAIRGVNCDGVMRTLATRGLIEECGTEGETGAHLYRTTALFLEKLGLNSVEQLPPLAPFLPDDVEEVLDATG